MADSTRAFPVALLGSAPAPPPADAPRDGDGVMRFPVTSSAMGAPAPALAAPRGHGASEPAPLLWLVTANPASQLHDAPNTFHSGVNGAAASSQITPFWTMRDTPAPVFALNAGAASEHAREVVATAGLDAPRAPLSHLLTLSGVFLPPATTHSPLHALPAYVLASATPARVSATEKAAVLAACPAALPAHAHGGALLCAAPQTAAAAAAAERQACPFCTRRLKVSSSMAAHMRTHTGERPFLCTERGCNRTFSQRSNRDRHVLTHRNVRPFKCLLCGLAFSRRYGLQRHMGHVHRVENGSV